MLKEIQIASPNVLEKFKISGQIGKTSDMINEFIKSFKKLIPTLELYPNAFIVTADDDIYYPYSWLETLCNYYKGNQKEVICHRAHKIKLNENNLPLPYLKWEHPKKKLVSDILIFPGTGGGVLYPPGVFKNEIFNQSVFKKICFTSDDIWFWWMSRLNNSFATITGKFNRIIKVQYY